MSSAPRGDEELDVLLAKIPEQSPPSACLDDALLLAYSRRRLEDEELTAVEDHLAACTACRELLAEVGEVPAPLASWAKGALRRRRSRWPRIAGVTALAAGALIAVLSIPRDRELPEYVVQGPHGGVQSTRGDGENSRLFVPSSPFALVLRPEAPITTPVSLVVFVSDPDGRLHAAPAEGLSKGEGGTFRYELQASRLFGSDYGARTIHVAIVSEPDARIPLEGSEAELRKNLPSHRWMTIQIDYAASIGGAAGSEDR